MSAIDEWHPVIKPRRVTFDWSDVPLHWVPGSPIATHGMNALQLLLPAGERWFVHVFKQALPLIDDERLHAEAKGFMGQEAVHARAHATVYEHLRAHGLDAQRAADRVEFLFTKLLGDAPPPPLRWLPRGQWLRVRLGLIAGIEHYTAVMGHWILNADALDEADVHPVMLDLFRWHGAEEVEHRSVAFDVFQHVSGSYPRRVSTMLVAFLGLWYAIHHGTGLLIENDPILRHQAAASGRRARFRYRDWNHAARLGLLPSLWSLARELPTYLRRGYHPSRTGSTQQAIDYLGTSPAALAARTSA
ncbi:MAG: metal-dependent hydrolase [Actinomadura sp.]